MNRRGWAPPSLKVSAMVAVSDFSNILWKWNKRDFFYQNLYCKKKGYSVTDRDSELGLA
jgi:hypothetical protein